MRAGQHLEPLQKGIERLAGLDLLVLLDQHAGQPERRLQVVWLLIQPHPGDVAQLIEAPRTTIKSGELLVGGLVARVQLQHPTVSRDRPDDRRQLQRAH